MKLAKDCRKILWEGRSRATCMMRLSLFAIVDRGRILVISDSEMS